MERNTLVALLVVSVLVGGVVSAATVEWSASQSVAIDAVDGPEITLDEAYNPTSQYPTPDSNTVDLGTIAFESAGSTSANVSSIGGSETTLSNIQTNGNTLWADHQSVRRIGVDGADAITWDTIDLADETSTEISTTGSGTVYVDGFSADQWVAVDRGGGLALAQADSSGVISFTTSGEDITLRNPSEPVLTNQSPVNEERIDSSPVTLQADLSHEDIDAESIDVVWHLNGQQIATGTATAETTLSKDVTNLQDGTNTWNVTVTDTTGDTAVASGSFATPATLEIRDELDQSLVDSATATVTFFGDDESVVTRTTSDGTIDMSGLPLDESFIVQVEADGYVTRESFARSVVERQTVYVLPDTADTVETQFEIDDPTGQFEAQSTRVFVKKPITDGGTTTYETVVADNLGTGTWTTTLEQGGRYLIEVENANTGEIRQLGPYVASVSELVTLEVDQLEYQFSGQIAKSGYRWNATYVNQTEPTIEFQFAANETVDRFHVTISERYNDSRVILDEQRVNHNGPIVLEAPIPETVDNPDQTTWNVTWTATVDGETTESSTLVGKSGLPANIPGVGDEILSMVGILAIFVVAGLFSQANFSVGAITTALVAAGLWFVGILPNAVSGLFIAIALLVGVLYHVHRGPQPR